VQPSGSGGTGDTTGGLGEMGVPLDAGGYGREGSDDFYRSRATVHGRRPQMVVQGGLKGLWGNDTPSVGSGGRSGGVWRVLRPVHRRSEGHSSES